GTTDQAEPSVARTSASTFSASNAEWPASHLGRRGNGPARRCRPAAGTTDQAKPSVARTSVSTLSASNAEWPASHLGRR
ncbi:hypothetical protein, partial [Stenotrophomonas pavanii]|uniref:hypothetical protein n=1 Tax=Stenotrophomonas pavanii TaxID=487698 RepID=UPI0039C6E3A5